MEEYKKPKEQPDNKSSNPLTDEENLSKQPVAETDQAAITNLTTQTSAEINSLQTKVMEVHHHPDLHHKPKKWKEYFFEFLMIFLAVTMGFFAESIREHFGDREKENQNIENVLRC